MTTRDQVLACVREQLEKEAGKGKKDVALAGLRGAVRKGARKLMIGGGLIAGGAAAAGGVTAAKEEAKKTLAPPTALPPGY